MCVEKEKMVSEKVYIGNIPAIIWGKKSDKAYIYVHGKMSDKESAEVFAQIAETKGFQTISFDLPEHGERKKEAYPCNIWNGIADLNQIADFAFTNWKELSLYACSLGAYFSLQAYRKRTFASCLFLSPIVDMEFLIQRMFEWFQVSEEMLYIKKEIQTPIDTLSWDYYQYVCKNPVTKWDNPTHILYGAKDNMQSLSVIKQFVEKHGCSFTVSKDSEHAFMEKADEEKIVEWLDKNI